MSYFVYIIQSGTDGSYYVGSTYAPTLRVLRHNAGWSRSTKGRGPWRLVYTEQHDTKSQALRRERMIKRRKSRAYVEGLIRHAGGRPDAP